MRSLTGLALACWLLGGCVSLTPEQQRSAEEIRAFVAETAAVYHVPKVYVLVGNDVRYVGGSYTRGMITVSTPMLRSRHRDALVAHELAHYLLDHDRLLSGPTPLDYQRQQESRELEANVKAVEVLVRARHLSGPLALSRMYDSVLSFYRAVTLEHAVVPRGHRPPCTEIADLLARFPRHRRWTALLECADGVAAPVGAVAAVPPPVDAAGPAFERAYLSDRLPGTGAPPQVERFHPSRDRAVVVVLAPRMRTADVTTRWFDPSGVERRRTMGAGAQPVAMWELRPWPGRWMVRLSVDGRPAGDLAFTIGPAPAVDAAEQLTSSGAGR